jgi:uncharacterized coiled-coil protein SlyX
MELAALRWLIRAVSYLMDRQEDILATLIEQIQEAAAATGQAATDAANRVIATINESNAAIAALQEHNAEDDAAIAALEQQIADGTVTPEAAQAVLDQLTAAKTAIDAIDAAPVPELPPVEEAPAS